MNHRRSGQDIPMKRNRLIADLIGQPRVLATVTLMCCSSLSVVSVHGQDTGTETAPAEATPPAPPTTPLPPGAPPLLPTEMKDTNNPGQADLDEAVLKRIDAESNEDLEAVASLIESALAKGLDEENQSFAKKMLGSIQLQRGQGLAAAMTRMRGRRALQLRDEAIRVLEQAIINDPALAEAHMMIARLNLLPDGDKDRIAEATSAAIELLEDDPKERSTAYLLRAVTQDKIADQLADLSQAIELDPTNAEAVRQRAGLRLQEGKFDEAVEDLQKVLELDPTNEQIAAATVQQLVEMGRADDAIELLSKTIQAQPSEGLYRLRALLFTNMDREEEALADLNKALAMQPKDPIALLQRAEIALRRDDVKDAKRDLDAAIDLAPQVEQLDQAIVVRCFIAVEEGRMADAINDMKLLIDRSPDDVYRQLQLANLYLQDDRPRQAIDMLSGVLDRDPNNASVLRSRGDAYLAVGDHAEAIADYEKALTNLDEDNEGDAIILPSVLNNLAWVLATSPKDDVRNGARSLELGLRAVELTKEEEAHILSTLAAGYAETGDFENARKWSEKAVEAAKKEIEEGADEESVQINQLQEELDSYKSEKPWREKQDTEENQVPLLSPDDLIDT
ncbi:tetratricopeptide repeat protein [Rhodopirellula halodulae]|uniref:tetratricopeptide repeat protein n=1 Tax=Rhodopirellula halodulae TaxID=2894198 RepID=UPI0028F43959|nr:tetratricopeptide repeat protein [Rhodopirellula sp. JC737]